MVLVCGDNCADCTVGIFAFVWFYSKTASGLYRVGGAVFINGVFRRMAATCFGMGGGFAVLAGVDAALAVAKVVLARWAACSYRSSRVDDADTVLVCPAPAAVGR